MGRLASAARLRRVISLALAALLFAGMAGAAAPAFAVRTLGLSSPSFDFNVAPGGRGSGDLSVSNDGTEPLRVLVYFANQKVDAKGNVSFESPTVGNPDFLNSPASWCQVRLPKDTQSIGNVPFLDLKPKERVPVTFTFNVPAGVAPGDHQVLLFFEMMDTEAATSGVATKVQGRIGSHIHVRVQGAVNEVFDVRPFTVRQLVIGDTMPWQFTLRNDGNIDEQVNTSLVVLDGSENERIKSDVSTDTVVYAKSLAERSGSLNVGAAPFGQFTVRLTSTYVDRASGSGGSKTVVKDRTIWVTPLWVVVLVIVLVGVLFLWLSWRAAVRSAERRADRRESRSSGPAARIRRSGARARVRKEPSDEDDYGDEYEDVAETPAPADDGSPRAD